MSKSSAQAKATRPAILDLKPSALVLVGLALAGTVLIFFVHDFRMTPSVLFLDLGWLSIVGASALLWNVGLLVAAGDEGDDGSFGTVSTRKEELEVEKTSLLKAIKEIEFDRMMGKLSDRDAEEITSAYRKRAIRILRELDVKELEEDEGSADLSVKDKIERDLRIRAQLARANKSTAARVDARKAREGDTLSSKMDKVRRAADARKAKAGAEEEE